MWVKFNVSWTSVWGSVTSLTVSTPKEADLLVSKLTPTRKLACALCGVSSYSGSLSVRTSRPPTKLQLELRRVSGGKGAPPSSGASGLEVRPGRASGVHNRAWCSSSPRTRSRWKRGRSGFRRAWEGAALFPGAAVSLCCLCSAPARVSARGARGPRPSPGPCGEEPSLDVKATTCHHKYSEKARQPQAPAS